MAYAQDRQSIDEGRQVRPNERISLNVLRGEVAIHPGEDNLLRIQGRLDRQAEGFELDSANGFTQFTVVMPRRLRGGSRGDGSELVITVPEGSEIEFRGVDVDVDIRGVRGGAKVTTVNGEIVASDLGEYVQLQTVNGRINSENNRGRIEIENVNADLRDRGSQGRISLKTINGKIAVENRAEEISFSVVNGEVDANLEGTRSVEFSTVNGTVDVRLRDSERPRVRGSSVSGSIRLELDPDVDARFDVQSNVGRRIENRLTDDEAERARFGPGASLRFMTGSGAGSVDISTVSGGIRIDRN